jgi:hypothetical protein
MGRAFEIKFNNGPIGKTMSDVSDVSDVFGPQHGLPNGSASALALAARAGEAGLYAY